MRDGLSLRAVKWLVRLINGLELRARRRWSRLKPRYRLSGTCNGCGRCCERPSVHVGRVTWHVRSVRTAFLWWQRQINGFEFVQADPRLRLFSFRCTHYQSETRTCDSYDSRPLMCRDYPVNLTFEAVPELFAECSHTVIDKDASALLGALEHAGVDPEKLAEIRKKLFLG